MKFFAPLLVACLLPAFVWAEITPGAAADAANRSSERPSLTSILEKANQDAASSVGSAGEADNTKLLKDHLTQEQRAERAAAITGIPATRIRQLAYDYATTRPAAIRINYGLQRHTGGGMAVRTIACLPALVGAWRDYGGGIQLSTSGFARHLDKQGLYRPDLLNGRQPRTINMNRLGDALSLDRSRLARAHNHPRPIDAIPTPDQGPQIAETTRPAIRRSSHKASLLSASLAAE